VQPGASHNTLGDPIYEEFYGLKEQPFAISTDPRFHFFSASHQRAYQELITGLQRGEALLLLTGEAGTGKTTLSRAVLAGLGDRTFAALVLNPYMSGGEILKLILRDFGLISREHLRQGALARAEPSQLLETLEGFLLTISAVKSRAVVIIDEAQSLAAAALDQVRLLTALERNGQHLIQVIFGGQPKLLDTLKKDNMYALNERITRRVHLGPLLESEVRAYVDHRLAVAGGADRVRFDDDAVQLLADMSRGLPRRVNVLADRALQEGRVESASVITGAMVRRAARLLSGPQKPPVPPPVPVTAAPPVAAAPALAADEPQVVAPPKIQLPTPEITIPAEGGAPISIFATFAAPPEPAPVAVPVAPIAPVAFSPEPDTDVIERPFQELAPPPPPAAAAAAAATDPSFVLKVSSRRAGPVARAAMALAVVVLLAMIGYAFYVGQILGTGANVPAAPERPATFTTRPAGALPTPTWSEADAWVEELRRIVQSAGPGFAVGVPRRGGGGT
jgi:general secretion pathway protein A